MVTLHEGLGASACGCSPLGSPFYRAHLSLQTYHETFIPFGLTSLPSATSSTLSLLALSVLASYCPHPARSYRTSSSSRCVQGPTEIPPELSTYPVNAVGSPH